MFGLVPAWQVSRHDLNHTLKDSGRGLVAGRSHHRARNVLVVAELALAFMLLIGSGLFIRSLQRIGGMNPGFKMDHLLTAQLSLPAARYQTALQRTHFASR